MIDVLLTKNTLNDRYQIREKIGNNLQRSTFLAQDLQTNNSVIIKILEFNSNFCWEDLKLFEREVETLKHLNHPAIPQYLNYFELDEDNLQGFALVQTYIEASNLETLIKQGQKFSEIELIQLAEKLLEILIYLHQLNPPIIHRDIKPSNILLTNRSGNNLGDVYLVDFGSVQTVARKEQGTITIVGSYGYIPLEQFGGQTTSASDLYSLGMTMIYLLTGIHPSELSFTQGKVIFDRTTISNHFAKWLDQMIHPHLDKRFESAQVALSVLQSPEQNLGGNLVSLRPQDTKIKLYRDSDKLEISILDRNLWLSVVKTIHFVPLILLIVYLGGFGFFIYCLCFLSFLSPLISFLCNNLCKYFRIEPDTCAWTYQIISIAKDSTIRIGRYGNPDSIKWCKRSWSKHSQNKVTMVAYNPGYRFDRYLDNNGREQKRGEVTVAPKLSVYAGNIEYRVGNQETTQAELWWLGKEISDFLEMELQIIYPTPKVPPEVSCGCGC